MELDLIKLKEILSESYSNGYHGINEQDSITRLCAKYDISEKNDQIWDNGEFRVFTVQELAKLPTGTKIIHEDEEMSKHLGFGQIVEEMGQKFVIFSNLVYKPAAIISNSYPWDKKIKIIFDYNPDYE